MQTADSPSFLIVQYIVGKLPEILAAIVAAMIYYRVRKQETGMDVVKQDVVGMNIAVNGRMDELLDLTRKASKAEGILEEKNQQVLRTAAKLEGEKRALAETISGVKPIAAIVLAIALSFGMGCGGGAYHAKNAGSRPAGDSFEQTVGARLVETQTALEEARRQI